MFVKLIRRTFEDRPDWELINDSVPLGTIYEVLGFERDAIIGNHILKEHRKVSLYLLRGNHDEGWLPVECFEVIKDAQSKSSPSL